MSTSMRNAGRGNRAIDTLNLTERIRKERNVGLARNLMPYPSVTDKRKLKVTPAIEPDYDEEEKCV